MEKTSSIHRTEVYLRVKLERLAPVHYFVSQVELMMLKIGLSRIFSYNVLSHKDDVPMLPQEFGDFMWLSNDDYVKLTYMDRNTALRYISEEDYDSIMQKLPVQKKIYYRLRAITQSLH